MFACTHDQLGWCRLAPCPQSAHAPSGGQRAHRPAKRSLPASKADIVGTLPAMATPPNGVQAERPSTNIKIPVHAETWAKAARYAMGSAAAEALDDPKKVWEERILLKKEAYKYFHEHPDGPGACEVGEEPIFPQDSRAFILQRCIPEERRDAAAQRLRQRGRRVPPAPLVCNHFFKPGSCSDENREFRRQFPLTLIYEYKVPSGPQKGRLMPVWIGSFEVAMEFPGPDLLMQRGVTALMNFCKADEDRNFHNARFKCLKSGIELNREFFEVHTEEAVLKKGAKLLKARPFSLSCWGAQPPHLPPPAPLPPGRRRGPRQNHRAPLQRLRRCLHLLCSGRPPLAHHRGVLPDADQPGQLTAGGVHGDCDCAEATVLEGLCRSGGQDDVTHL